MKKEVIVCLIFLTLIFGIAIVHSQDSELSKIDPVRVVIDIKEPSKEKGLIFKTEKTSEEILQEKIEVKENIIEQIGEENVKHVFEDSLAVEIANEEIERLKRNPDVESITQDRPIIAFLSTSVPLVNATRSWALQYNGINLTGVDETICIIDTGANFSHPDLIGRNRTCVIDCVSKSCVENCSVYDDNGHGTHVAGIVGANGFLKGVAIGVKIIGVKVLNSAGSGSGSDLDAGIDWCIANTNSYNISVISMSLGTPCVYSNGTATGWCYNSYCDNIASEESTAVKIDTAISKNISVIVATGNDANFTHISSPACVKNATAVGATDISDNIATSYSNRNNLTDLFAPGSSINSTRGYTGGCLSGCSCSGNYMVCSGTSMATPHVAGAFAIIRQYFRLQNGMMPTPQEIENVLNSTGRIIHDSNAGLDFSRINIYSGILSLDNAPPNITLISPIDNSLNTTANQTFYCNASDFQLKNITFYLWNSSDELIYNSSQNISGVYNSSSFNVSNLNYDNYKWNCKAFDMNNYFAYASSNFSIRTTHLSANLNSPSNNYKTNQNQSYNCSFISNGSFSLVNSTFYIWDSNNNLVYNASQNISGTTNVSVYNYNFSGEGNFSWNCRVFNNISNSLFGDVNYSIKYDATSPVINSLNSSVTTSGATITWNNSENTNVSLIYGINNSNLNLSYRDSIFSSSNSTTLSSLLSSTVYYYNITFCDDIGNCIVNGTNNFTTSAAEVVISSSGSIGGSGGSSEGNAINTYNVSYEQGSKGYTQLLNNKDKIKFIFFDSKFLQHTLIVNNIKEDYVNITILSNPINLLLGVGQSAKLNLTSSNFYDLYVKLESIENNKAKITIQIIHEEIINPNLGKIINKSNEKPMDTSLNNPPQDNKESYNNIKYILIMSLIPLIIIVIIILFYIRNRAFVKKKKNIKEYKEKFKQIKPKI